MNKSLIKALANRILEHPEDYNQSVWCGTSCCMAGHLWIMKNGALVSGSYPSVIKIFQFAKAELGLTDDQAHRLFTCALNWPEPYSTNYHRAAVEDGTANRQAMAQAGYDRIMHMVRTGE